MQNAVAKLHGSGVATIGRPYGERRLRPSTAGSSSGKDHQGGGAEREGANYAAISEGHSNSPVTGFLTRSPISFGLLIGLAACAPASPDEAMRPAPLPPPAPKVTAEDIQRSPSVPIEDLLTAKIAGVWVSRTSDGGIAIRIRGATTISGSQEPLFVLNGLPIQAGPNGSLPGIAPSEIESIEVLKDAASTAMYGLRGANGVIIIKTKSANQ